MQPVITIRHAEVEDAAAISALVTEAYTPYIARIGKKPAPMLDDYRQVIADDEVFVLTHDAVIAGVLVVSQEDTTLLLGYAMKRMVRVLQHEKPHYLLSCLCSAVPIKLKKKYTCTSSI